MEKRMNVYIYTKNDEKSLKMRATIEEALTTEGFATLDTDEHANIILSLGSDGTFLQAVRRTNFRQDCLYAGILTTEGTSLYCDFHYDNLPEMVQTIRNTEIEVKRYPLLEISIDNHAPFYCLNELTIRSNIVRTFALDVMINEKKFESFRGDGLVISTPTGSTAYNKSIRGAVVDPSLECFQVTELASINSNKFRTLGSPFILSGNRALQLKVHDRENSFPIMAADNEALPVRKIDDINISLSDKTIKTVKLKNNSFWDKVQRLFL